jgi:hypothetical protein
VRLSPSPHLALLALLSTLVGCNGGGGGGDTPVSPPSGLSYASPQVYVVAQAIAPLMPSVTGSVSTWSVAPALPQGLSLNPTNGAITGTPTKPSVLAGYTVTAANQGGSASATVTLTVNDAKPAVSYPNSAFSFTTEVPIAPISPTSTGGAVTTWSINPALPPGLSLGASDGTIAGTPTASSAAASYMVTAANSGGTTTATVRLGVESGVLLDLGHWAGINVIRYEPSRILSIDAEGHWVLWDSQTTVSIARGDASCAGPCASPIPGDLAGSTVAIKTSAGVELRSSVDGRVTASIATSAKWWALASDGSYLVAGDTSNLTAWSPSGVVLLTRAGDYSKAATYAAPNEIRVALGPAGDHVIERIAMSSGTGSSTPVFQGDFSSWFLDGARFITKLGNTVWIYSKDGAQLDIKALTATYSLTGQGQWFWTSSNYYGGALDIYKVGASANPTASYSFAGSPFLPSRDSIGVPGDMLTLIDLSGSSPTRVDYPSPLASVTAFALLAPGQWVVGDGSGVLADAATPTKYFGIGRALAITGSSRRVALATTIRGITYFDAATKNEEGRTGPPITSARLALSDDGSVLAVARNVNDGVDHPLDVYALPGASLIKSWLYPYGGDPSLRDISLAGSGLVVGKAGASSAKYWRQVDTTAGATVWSDLVNPPVTILLDFSELAPRLSPDGTLIAASDRDRSEYTTTRIYKDGQLATAVTGWAVGWIDDNRLLVNRYTNPHYLTYTGCAIVDPSGTTIGTCALPELYSLQRVAADSIYSPERNAIFSVSTGQATWTSPNPSRGDGVSTSFVLQYRGILGAVAGPYVVFASGATIRAERFE